MGWKAVLRASIFLQNWRELRSCLLSWAVGLTLYIFFVMYMVPLVLQPAALLRLNRSLAEFQQPIAPILNPVAQWVMVATFSFILPFLLSIPAMWIGAGIMPKAEQNGELTLWLAQPVARWQIVLQKYSILLIVVFLLATWTCLLMVICNRLLGLSLPVGGLILGNVSSGLTALTCGSLAFLLGTLKGRASLSRLYSMVALGLSVVLFLLRTLPQPLRLLSPFTLNAGLSPFGSSYQPFWVLLILAGINFILYLASHIGFRQRDLNI